MEQNREFRNRPTHILSTDFDTNTKAIQLRKNSLLKQMTLGQLDSHMPNKKL